MGTSGRNTSPSPQILVLLVNGSQLLSAALESLLTKDRQIALVGTERNGQAAAARLSRTRADVVVLCGIRYPEDLPNEIAPVLRARPEIRVLVLGSVHSERAQLASLDAGAVGFISEDVDADEFVDAIKRVHAGEVLFMQSVLVNLVHRARQRSRGGSHSGEVPVLAPREIEVLQAFGRGLNTEDVAERLGITVSTVRTHLKKILEKQGAHSRLEAVIIGLRTGLITLSDDDVRPPAHRPSTQANGNTRHVQRSWQ